MASAKATNWWRDAIIYQIYPSSFKDDNGDGWGDLAGITSKLDYIKNLGVDTVWISPCYDSPQIDMGYDISNYEAIYPPYGDMKDMDHLIAEAKKRGLRLLMDLVINHTSDQHAWFKESASSRDNPKRDWYIWHDGIVEDGKRRAPNNWRANFSTPAWTWHEPTQQYYMNLFAPEQPDLNWENPVTRKAIYDSAIHYWLKKGIDGFRVDTVNMYSKGEYVNRHAPVIDKSRWDQPAGHLYCNGPRIHEFIREMYKEALSPYGDVMTVGELPNCHTKEGILSYVSASDPQLSMVFQFDVVDLGTGGPVGKRRFEAQPFTLSEYKKTWDRMQDTTADTDGWNTVFIENHDQARAVSRFGNDAPEWRVPSAKVLATQIATMRGTLFVYQGQELGMINMPTSWGLEEYKDMGSINYLKEVIDDEGDTEKNRQHTLTCLQKLARDHSRVPVQWTSGKDSGFSPADAKKEPWMKVNDTYKEINAEVEEKDEDSVLNYYRKVLKFRKDNADLFRAGSYRCLDLDNEKVFAFERVLNDEAALVLMNFSTDEVETGVQEKGDWKYQYGNYKDAKEAQEKLRGWEARVYKRN